MKPAFKIASLSLAVAASGTLGCVSGAALRAKSSSIKEKLEVVRYSGLHCAERELALAESHLAFARLELSQGAYFRAREHLAISLDNAAKVEVVSRRPECQEVFDRDGDGIRDKVDLCPDAPEDMDGYEDTDGCPEDQDTDGDRIPDSRDRCPNDPEDYDGVEDEDGCPDLTMDRDGDGIEDSKDQCPDQPEDKDQFEDLNGCPDPDNDKDGVLDVVDKCPLQPEDIDTFEDEDGCPDPDNDKDRIPDVTDKCPLEPEDYDGDADEDGCPDIYKSIVVTANRIELKQTVFFKTNSDRIKSVSYGLLNEVAMALRDRPKITVRIEGHTDSRGSARYNKKLSSRRAASVRRYLMGQGVASSRMVSEGLGEESPIEDNRTKSGRAANRRVEFHITSQ